jgi:predicted outer membrane protein
MMGLEPAMQCLSIVRVGVSIAALACLAASAPQARVDLTFVSNAAVGNLGAIALAELAVKRGSPEVRDVARMIIDDRRFATAELGRIAARDGYTLPIQRLPEQQILYNWMAALPRKNFDRAYLAEVGRQQRRADTLLREQMRHGVNPALRNYARAMLRPLSDTTDVAFRAFQRL